MLRPCVASRNRPFFETPPSVLISGCGVLTGCRVRDISSVMALWERWSWTWGNTASKPHQHREVETMDAPESLVQLVRSEAERLERYLATLPPEAWTRPSACERWEVRDVVGHLVFWAEPYANAILRAVHGDISPPEGWPPPETLAGPSMMDFSADTAISC